MRKINAPCTCTRSSSHKRSFGRYQARSRGRSICRSSVCVDLPGTTILLALNSVFLSSQRVVNIRARLIITTPFFSSSYGQGLMPALMVRSWSLPPVLVAKLTRITVHCSTSVKSMRAFGPRVMHSIRCSERRLMRPSAALCRRLAPNSSRL